MEAKTDSCGTPFLRRRNLLCIPLPVIRVKLRFVCKLHDHFDHAPVWQQTQKLAGEAAVPYIIIGCCEISKHSTSLLSFFSFWPKSSPRCPESKLIDLLLISHVRNQLAPLGKVG